MLLFGCLQFLLRFLSSSLVFRFISRCSLRSCAFCSLYFLRRRERRARVRSREDLWHFTIILCFSEVRFECTRTKARKHSEAIFFVRSSRCGGENTLWLLCVCLCSCVSVFVDGNNRCTVVPIKMQLWLAECDKQNECTLTEKISSTRKKRTKLLRNRNRILWMSREEARAVNRFWSVRNSGESNIITVAYRMTNRIGALTSTSHRRRFMPKTS